MTRVRQSLLLSAADNYLAVLLQLASTVIISRLLTPAEIGTFAIAAVFAALASTFRDFGVAEYLIQERALTAQKIRAAFALNIVVSWSMALTLVALSPFAARFYGEPGVGHVMLVQAATFVIVPFGAITMAWFRRELNYRPIVICNVLSNVAGFVVAVTLAFQGFGYMSLAWSSLASIVVVVSATLWFRPATLPRWPALRGIGEVFHFGKFTSAIYVLNTLGRGAPELIIGRAQGAAAVGMFSRANGLLEMFNRLTMSPLMQVCLPYFAQQGRQQGALAPAYTLSVSLLTALGWPFLGCIAVMAYAAIRIVYGPQWLAAVPLAQVLCLAGAIDLLFLLAREALLADGRARQASVMQFQFFALKVAGLAAVVPFGLPGAAWGLAAAAACNAVLGARHLRVLDVRIGAVARACVPSALLTLVAVGPLALAAWWLPPSEANYLRWALAGAGYAALSWLAGLRLLRHRLWDELTALARRALRRTGAA